MAAMAPLPPSRPPPPKGPPPKPPTSRPPPPRRPPPPPPRASNSNGSPRPPPARPNSNGSPRPPPTATKPPGKRPAEVSISSRPTKERKIFVPKVLNDVDIYKKQRQVGQGTYGSVFVGAHKKSGEIVALKRINTEQEENGFPITALREVKILKALRHPNIVNLKEIVTSKGTYSLFLKQFFFVDDMAICDFDSCPVKFLLDTTENRLV